MRRLGSHFVTLLLIFIISSSLQAASFEEFSQNKRLVDGFFPLYIDDESGNVYLDVVRLDSPFLFQSSLPRGLGSNDIGLDRGQLGATRLVQFEKVGKKILLRQLNTQYRAESDNAAERLSVREAFTDAVIYGFNVEVKDDEHLIIDYTPFLLSDIHSVSKRLSDRKQGGFSVDKARSAPYFPRTKGFPKNTELEALLSFKGSGAGEYLLSVAADRNNITVHSHHSLVELPDDKYQPRAFHPFSGFWSIEYQDYAAAIDEPMTKRLIPRHRLQKKDPSSPVSEAVEPIIYYLDPGVPEPIRSALLDGAKWWDQAFQAIGYKDAFQVKILPDDADPMDLRYNVIQWVHRSTRGWSYGASVIDPRTGEIIKGHVTLGSLRVRQDYLIAQGLLSPFANNDVDTSAMKAMALARIRQLSAHEVGHTLGIAHNFAASEDELASVMDYPHPRVKLVDGKVTIDNAYGVGIGSWDKHVIAYGYSDNVSNEDLAAIIADAQTQGLGYMSDPDSRPQSGANSAGHLWDNGKNAADELTRVLAVRAAALEQFGVNSIPAGVPYSQLEEVLMPVFYFHRYQTEAAVKAIAGVDYRYELKSAEPVFGAKIVPAEQQQAALSALLKTLDASVLTLDESILSVIPPKAYGYSRTRESAPTQTGLTLDPIAMAEAGAEHTLNLLLNKQRLNRLAQQASRNNQLFSVADLFQQLADATVNVKRQNDLVGQIGRRINVLVLEHILELAFNTDVAPEVSASARLFVKEMQAKLARLAFRKGANEVVTAHYYQLHSMLKQANERGAFVRDRKISKMPPGSPI